MMSKPFPGPWTFKHHPWLREMHNSEASMNVGMKAAQMGFTEWALNETFFHIDVKGVDCLYVLPSEGDAGDFSAGRFDPALEESPHLRNLFSNVRNVGHKRAGSANLYIRGSRSRSKLKSIPTGFIVFDEVDEMSQDNIPLAMERASGQLSRQVLMISTPTIEKDDYGIFGYFMNTTQEHYQFKCPGCDKFIEFLFPESVIICGEHRNDPDIKKSHYICHKCGKVLHHEQKPELLANGKFVQTVAGRDERGFTVNQLYSSAQAGQPENIVKAYLDGQEDPAKEQEFFNSKLALPHTVAGARLDDHDIDNCIKPFRIGKTHDVNGYVTLGVDVGKTIYYEVDEYRLVDKGIEVNDMAICRILDANTCVAFEQLDEVMRKYNVNFCIVDRHPEMRAAYQFATRFWGKVLLCMYGRGITGKQLQIGTESEKTVTVDRTSWLDLSLGRFRSGRAHLPQNIPNEYRSHLKNLVRSYEVDSQGNPFVRYVDIGPDHFAHARNYAEIAFPFAAELGGHQNIRKVE